MCLFFSFAYSRKVKSNWNGLKEVQLEQCQERRATLMSSCEAQQKRTWEVCSVWRGLPIEVVLAAWAF